MIYRASNNNFCIHKFHQFCDNYNNTIVFIKTEFNKIIGGFTNLSWKSTNGTLHCDIHKQSFLFSLNLKQKMNLIDSKNAIFNSIEFGPTFGAGADLAICHHANIEKTSYTQFPYSYSNIRYPQNNLHTTRLFTGVEIGTHFLIKQWQVWRIIFN